MRHEELPRRTYVILFSFLILTLSQVHFPELIIFVVLLFGLSVFRPALKLRLFDSAVSLIIGLSASVPLTYLSQKIFH